MSKSFAIKTIRLVITLGVGVFSEGGNTKTIEGLAVEAQVTKPGLPEKNSASIKVWGLNYNDMSQLTMLAFKPLESQRNKISIFAGDVGGSLSLVFAGDITSAFADFNSSPDVCMQIDSDTGTYPQQIAKPVLTTDGIAEVDKLFAGFAADCGYDYVNEGVTGSVKNVWLPGSPVDKATRLAKQINANILLDDDAMIISNTGQARSGNAIKLSKDTGLIGYPTFTQEGISLRCLYNPELAQNKLVVVDSIVPRASGTWRIKKLEHKLSAYTPGGCDWESTVEGVYYG